MPLTPESKLPSEIRLVNKESLHHPMNEFFVKAFERRSRKKYVLMSRRRSCIWVPNHHKEDWSLVNNIQHSKR